MLKRQILRYRQIVDRIEAIARTGVEEPLHVADLCHVAAVSERTLRNAFRRICGMSPYRYLRTYRLAQARQALLSADVEPGAVTQVAMRFGFLELGRFAVDYRSTFGECPSETLRRSPAAPHGLCASRAGSKSPSGFVHRAAPSPSRMLDIHNRACADAREGGGQAGVSSPNWM